MFSQHGFEFNRITGSDHRQYRHTLTGQNVHTVNSLSDHRAVNNFAAEIHVNRRYTIVDANAPAMSTSGLRRLGGVPHPFNGVQDLVAVFWRS